MESDYENADKGADEMEQQTNSGVIGLTDTGQPIVLPEYGCEHWQPGKNRMLNSKTCWYCQYADFRKTTSITISQSICRCPQTRVIMVTGSENEALEEEGGANHA